MMLAHWRTEAKMFTCGIRGVGVTPIASALWRQKPAQAYYFHENRRFGITTIDDEIVEGYSGTALERDRSSGQ
jgi:hypothetical protein